MPDKAPTERSYLSLLIGIAGLFIAGWGLFSYISSLPWYLGKPSSQVQADYSAVGQSGQLKTVAEAAPVTNTTASSTKSNISAKNPVIILPYKATPFTGSDWIYDWGSASIESNTLDFGAAASTTGGDLFLANSNGLENYLVQANVEWVAGNSFGIIARFADGKNFVYCDFGDRTAQIVMRTNGVDTVVAQSAAINGGAGFTQNLGVSVFGSDIACSVNGLEILGTTIAQGDPMKGGVGLISWDATPGVSKIAINSFDVTTLVTDDIEVPFPAPNPVAPTSTVSATATLAAATSSAAATNDASSTVAATKLKLPYSETNFAGDANWQGTWGVMTIDSSNFMDIGSAPDSSGGSAILNNSDNWFNYRVSATVDWPEGETFMLIARYVDIGDYVACNFVQDPNDPSAVTIQLEKFVGGNEAILQTGIDTNFSREGKTNITVAFSVQDTQATCSFNGHQITNASADSYGISPIPGVIGFSTWDQTLGNTELIVKKVSVTSNY